ncbi:MAG: outer membrane beta-barrel protein, partial [candidate division Zixibacteria bacterium]|nr:outer membrane beta-barrel protein [candidate division Zixibacteria bacterium]
MMFPQWRLHRCVLSVTILLCGVVLLNPSAHAQDRPDHSGSYFVAPFGAVSFPTGRFGETDPDAVPPKSGHNTGYTIGADAGYYLTDGLVLGLSVRRTTFDIDFGDEIEEQFPAETAETEIVLAELWGRYFLPRGFEHWRPYLVAGVGLGRPKGTIEYEEPFVILLPDDGSINVQKLQSTVNTAVLVTGGIGVMVPVSRSIGLNLEPRYTVVST